jgi:hypothetical protein
MFLTKEAVRLGLLEYADGVACDGRPPRTEAGADEIESIDSALA